MTNANRTGYFQSPLGVIEIQVNDLALISVKFLGEEVFEENKSPQNNEIIMLTIGQLGQYFDGKLKEFDLPVQLEGTEFQRRVWSELKRIPFGKTISYSQLADKLGSRDLVRAVGSANGSNPLGIGVPCHRVVGRQGDLVGYAGGLWRKQWLLEHEDCQMLLPFY